jgi:hypothetical protein
VASYTGTPAEGQSGAPAGTAWNDPSVWVDLVSTDTDFSHYTWNVTWTELDPNNADNTATIAAATPAVSWASLFTSADGQTWTPVGVASEADLALVNPSFFGTVNGTGVAVVNGQLFTSADGTAWTSGPVLSGFGVIHKVIQGRGSTWLAVGDRGIATSEDYGQTWPTVLVATGAASNPVTNVVSRSSGLGSLGLTSAAYGNGTYVVIGQKATHEPAILVSTDAVTWSMVDYPTAMNPLTDITFGPAGFVAVARSGFGPPLILTSFNAINWNSQTFYSYLVNPSQVLWSPLGGGQYLIGSAIDMS